MKLIEKLFKNHSKTENHSAKKEFSTDKNDLEKPLRCSNSETNCKTKTVPDRNVEYNLLFEKIVGIKLGKTDIIPSLNHHKPHMVYQIQILTSDFQYVIKKRYSTFHCFYTQIKKEITHLQIQFPKKTLLVSGTNIDIVAQRYQQLNTFIKKVFQQIKQQKNRVLENKFIQFIQIDQQFSRRNGSSYAQLSIKRCKGDETSYCLQDTSISSELRKLNDYNHQHNIITRIQKYINYKNYRLTNDEIKLLLIGNPQEDFKGLLNLSLSINDEIKSLQLLRFLLDYISPQKKSYNQKIFRQFEKLPLQAFNFDYPKIRSNFYMVEFKQVFFIILQLYCQHKMFNEMKILEKYPELIQEFQVWKNFYELNEGNLCRKSPSTNNLGKLDLLRKPTLYVDKAKSFQLNPKMCEQSKQMLYPLASSQNLEYLTVNQFPENMQRNSSKSNDSTSEMTIEQAWENCKLKEELGQAQNMVYQQSFKTMKETQSYALKSNKLNKMVIELKRINKPLDECQRIVHKWNKLIYDQRHDPFTDISRIYMKLNGKSKIFKYKEEDTKIQREHQNSIRIVKKRLQSHNSMTKNDKQNLNEILKIKCSDHYNGFEQIISIENVISNSNADFYSNNQLVRPQEHIHISIQLNFQGEEQYFKTQIMGITYYLLDSAVQSFLN